MKNNTISSIDVLPVLTVHEDNVTSTKPVLVRICGELWRVDEKGVHRRGVFAEGIRGQRLPAGALAAMIEKLQLVR